MSDAARLRRPPPARPSQASGRLVPVLLSAVLGAGFLSVPLPLPAAQGTPDDPPGSPSGNGSRECLPDGDGARREALEWIDRLRREEGLEGLRVDPVLCAVAQERAEATAAAGSLDGRQDSIQRVSRRLHQSGYEAHRWTERAILGWNSPERMLERWRRSAPENLSGSVLGAFEEVGVGVARGDGGTALSVLLAVPRASELRRLTEPLRDLEEVRAEALEEVNRARHRADLPPLETDAHLDAAAQRYAETMLEEGFYGHVTPGGQTPRQRAEAAGYGPIALLAENIAKGLFEPGETVKRWLDSPDHRRNILHSRVEETGLGVAFGETGDGLEVVWVQLFGRRR